MATLYAGWANQNINDNWCDANDGVQDTAATAADDLVVNDTNDGLTNVTFNAVTFTCASMTITAGTLTLPDNRAMVGNLTINGANAYLVPNGKTLVMGGDYIFNLGTHTGNSLVLQMAVSANLKINGYGPRAAELIISSGQTATLTGETRTMKLSGAGNITGAQTLYVGDTSANNWWAYTGTINCTKVILIRCTHTPGGDIIIGTNTAVNLTTNTTQTQDSDLTVTGNLEISKTEALAGNPATLDMQGNNLSCSGTIYLGPSAGSVDDKSGTLKMGEGQHIINNIVGVLNCTSSVLDFESSTTILSGTINGTLIDGDHLNTAGIVVGGIIQNIDLTGETALVHIFPDPSDDGSTNTNVTRLFLAMSGLVYPGAGVAA